MTVPPLGLGNISSKSVGRYFKHVLYFEPFPLNLSEQNGRQYQILFYHRQTHPLLLHVLGQRRVAWALGNVLGRDYHFEGLLTQNIAHCRLSEL